MAVLNQVQLANDVKTLLDYLEKSQWFHKPDFNLINKFEIMSREMLRNKKMNKGLYTTKTSGSTGIPVSVEKTYMDLVWYIATNTREIIWRKWDVTKNIAFIKPGLKESVENNWGIPLNIFNVQGKRYTMGYEPISKIQKWLEKTNPHYIQCRPSIVSQLDLTKLTNLIDIKGTGELGGSMFSSEECGTISIQCPDNPNVHHVMENQIVETDNNGGMIISTISNPYLIRYKNGDHIELGKCTCGRTLQTIKKINGRVRNMFVLPNGDKKWPMIGSKEYYDKFGIKRYKAIQTNIDTIELHIISDNLGDRENELIYLVQDFLNSKINVIIKYVDDFPEYKFEEFISLVDLSK